MKNVSWLLRHFDGLMLITVDLLLFTFLLLIFRHYRPFLDVCLLFCFDYIFVTRRCRIFRFYFLLFQKEEQAS